MRPGIQIPACVHLRVPVYQTHFDVFSIAKGKSQILSLVTIAQVRNNSMEAKGIIQNSLPFNCDQNLGKEKHLFFVPLLVFLYLSLQISED